MVLSRNGKRKKKNGDIVELVDALPEGPKRTKIHAQRKFAHGAPALFTNTTPTSSPIKEKERPDSSTFTELISHKRPNPKDFLTFLCYRGTSLLPSSLDFLNENTNKDIKETKNSFSSSQIYNKNSPDSPKKSLVNVCSTSKNTNTKEKNFSTGKKEKKLLPVLPNTPKENNVKLKSTSTAIQALKKKYQEQRLAKQKFSKKFKATSLIMKTRSAIETDDIKTKNSTAFMKIASCSKLLDQKPQKKKSTLKSIKATVRNEKQDNNIVKEKPKAKYTGQFTASKPKLGNVSKSSKLIAKKPLNKDKVAIKRRFTRSLGENINCNNKLTVNKRPSRKTKEAAAIYMEILGRKLISSDLEDDDLSIDSFPELPKALKCSQLEHEDKLKADKKKAKTNKDKKVFLGKIVTSKAKKNKSNTLKNIANKSNSDKISERISKYTKPATRRNSSIECNTAILNPSSKSNCIKRKTTSKSTKVAMFEQHSLKKQKINVQKRKHDSDEKELKKSVTQKKQEIVKISRPHTSAIESEDETLGSILNKLQKSKACKEKSAKLESSKLEDKSSLTNNEPVLLQSNTLIAKISDDEESFRGFTQQSILKGIDNCESHEKANALHLLAAVVAEEKKIHDKNVYTKLCQKEMSNIKHETECYNTVKQLNNVKQEQYREFKDRVTKPLLNIADMPSIISKNRKECADGSNTTEENINKKVLNITDIPPMMPHSRKERFNMSTEQIEKWLNESSLANEESKDEMENVVSKFKCENEIEKPKSTHIITHRHLSISPKIQHLVRPVNVTVTKLSDRLKKSVMSPMQKKSASSLLNAQKLTIKIPSLTTQEKEKAEVQPVQCTESVSEGKHSDLTIEEKNKNALVPVPRSRKKSKDSSIDYCEDLKAEQNSVDLNSGKKDLQKKLFFHQKKPFLPKVKDRKITTNSNAFSPENESSVYAFETEIEAPVNTPFRRKQCREGNISSNSFEEKSKDNINKTSTTRLNLSAEAQRITEKRQQVEATEENNTKKIKSLPILSQSLPASPNISSSPKTFELPKNFADLSNIQVLPLDKLTTNWSDVNCTVAVQVNLEDNEQLTSGIGEGDQRSTEITTQANANIENDDDNDGTFFYIPLQAVTRHASSQGQQLIQGVAVKLGTEGPTGPNQRVMLKAKLVTKPPVSVARCPPIGTVQPTARLPQNNSTSQTNPLSSETEIIAEDVKDHSSASCIESADINIIKKPPKISPQLLSVDNAVKLSIKERKPHSSNIKRVSQSKPHENNPPESEISFEKTNDNEKRIREKLLEAPVFYPSEKDFQDPLEYIGKIRIFAEKFGICKVIPPKTFKPECKIFDEMRFTAYNQYIHRMLHRWGPNAKELRAIKKYLGTQSITLNQIPLIGGMEIDLPYLYQTVQSLGGLKEVIEKKKWQKVADGMKIPKSAQDRVTKLDDIYCKYLLPYETLSRDEKEKLFKDVDKEWIRKEQKGIRRQQSQSSEDDDSSDDSSDEIEECIVKGRNMPLSAFYRIARNTQRMWFGENVKLFNETEGACSDEVQSTFWTHVIEKKRHICVNSASIDSGGNKIGFSVAKNSPFGKHPWNLKILTNNSNSILKSMGPVMGVTVPTLHVGMLFSACCWYRDPHQLPWVEYLHTGAKKVWYGIPDEQNDNLRATLSKMFPRHCKNKKIWLPSDTAMVPPDILISNGIPLCRTIQEPGQFIIVFPKAFTSSICTGYAVSESVYFADHSWLETAEEVFKDIRESCEPSMFSFERLLFSIINDQKAHIDVLKQILPIVIKIHNEELKNRKRLKELGVTKTENLPCPGNDKRGKHKRMQEDSDYECDVCRTNLFVSSLSNHDEESLLCLRHGIQLIEKKKIIAKHYTLMYTYNEGELNSLIDKLKDRVDAKIKRHNQSSQSK